MFEAEKRLNELGINVKFGKTVWSQKKGRSCSIEQRVKEFESFFENEDIDIIMPPWGGSFLMEILPHVNWYKLKKLPPKWMIGYSDISTLLFVYTTLTGVATAHGQNFSELSAPIWDDTSKKWLDVLKCREGDTYIQYSSQMYQSTWELVYANPSSGFYFDSETEWKNINSNYKEKMEGRLIGGCLNTLQILIGTQFDYVQQFVKQFCPEGTILYLEPVGMNSAQIYRALWQMKQNNWFNNCNGILIGRAGGYSDLSDFTLLDALRDTFSNLNIPVFYDVDIGHMPPQLTLVNGAMTKVEIVNGKGTLEMNFI